MDQAGALAEYSIKGDVISCQFQKDPPLNAKCVGLITPVKNRNSSIYGEQRDRF